MTNGREMTPPPGFSTPPQIPNNTTSERPPVTTTVFAATTPENTPFAYLASTLTNPNPKISPAFMEVNYEILESLLRERRRQIRNEDLRTELEYFSEDYDEEREMEPRPEPRREATPTLWLRSLVGGHQPSTNMGGNLPPNGTLLSHHAQPFIPSSLHIPTRLVPIPVNPYSQPSVNLVNGQALNFPFQTQIGSFADSAGSVTPFVRWIEDYPLPDGLKMPSHIGSYDEKGNPDNFLHLFEGAIHMQKWLMPVACHMFTYTLKDFAHIWWNSQKTDHPFTYKGLMEKTYTWVEAREVATNGASSDRRDSFERSKKSSWDNNRGQRNKDRFSPYRGPNHGLLPSLSKSPKQNLTTEKTARSFEPPPKMFGIKRSRDMSKYCHFHEDYGHDTNDCRHLRIQIQEAVNSGQLSYLVKGIKKERTKSSDTPRGESKKDKGTAPAEEPILMVRLLTQYAVRKNSDAKDGNIVSTIHGAIKFHTEKGIGTVLSTDETDEGTKRARKIPAINEERVLSCVNAEEKIIVNDKYPDQTVTIRKQLPEHFKKELQNLLKSNADIFAWTHADMTGIPRTIMVEGKPFNTEHKLNKYSHVKPIKQNKRGLGPDRNMAACKETEELTKARILRKVKHQNIEIDWKIESLSGFHLKCFLDAYKDYHQIQMAEEDEDKTAFYAGEGVFCYKKMPFGLKNAGATYQRLVDKVFSHQIGRNLKTYVDDIVIKSTSEKEMLKYIQETFKRFRSINMKLNPKKFSFGVEEGPFLGHLITKQGIKANPSKIKAVTDLDQPRTLKDIQSLNGKLAAINRFLSKGAERSLAFFKVLKGYKHKKSIQWTTEADKALEEMKKLVQVLPTLTAPRVGETLTMHLAASKESISVVLAAKRNEGWTPIYFVSRVLQGAELNYPALEKLVLALDNEKKEKPKELPDSNSKWRLYTDEASNSDGSGAGLMFIDPEGKEYTYALRSEFETTNNEAEYEALLAVEHVRRNQNKKADALSKLASMTFEHLTKEVLVEVLTKRSIEEKEVLKVDTQERKAGWIPSMNIC
ncbi:reverse transcriptase domain-containing protein [Tanacetum coccineum]